MMRNLFKHSATQAPLSPLRSMTRSSLIRQSRFYQGHLLQLKRKARVSSSQRKELQYLTMRNKLLNLQKLYADPEFIKFSEALEQCDEGMGKPYEQLVLEIESSRIEESGGYKIHMYWQDLSRR